METQCETPGCFETTYGMPQCEKCINGMFPENRGPVTDREAMYARLQGGQNADVTRKRLIANGQPLQGL